MRELKEALPAALACARERALCIAEQLGLEEILRQRRTVHSEKRACLAAAPIVNPLRQHLLARARRACDEYGRIRPRVLLRLVLHRLTGGRDALDVLHMPFRNEPAIREFLADTALDTLHLGDALHAVDAPVRGAAHLDGRATSKIVLLMEVDDPLLIGALHGGKVRAKIRELLSHDLIARPLKDALRRGVEEGDLPRRIHRDDAVLRLVHDAAQEI